MALDDRIQIELKDGIVVITALGELDLELCDEVRDHLAQTYPNIHRLWDFRKISINFAMDDVRAIAQNAKIMLPGMATRIAFVAGDELSFGVLRQYGTFREEDGKSNVHVYRDFDEAAAWLRG
ncbi:MAG: hypothetical protein ACQKBV_10810 [Puniceicoccales bacterium]